MGGCWKTYSIPTATSIGVCPTGISARPTICRVLPTGLDRTGTLVNSTTLRRLGGLLPSIRTAARFGFPNS